MINEYTCMLQVVVPCFGFAELSEIGRTPTARPVWIDMMLAKCSNIFRAHGYKHPFYQLTHEQHESQPNEPCQSHHDL